MNLQPEDIQDENPYKHYQIECLSCGKIHNRTAHIYKRPLSVDEDGELRIIRELKCNKCGNIYDWRFRDKRAIRILEKHMKDTSMPEKDRILEAMSEYYILRRGRG